MIINRKAKYLYKLENEKFEAGISLSGGEAKSVRQRRGDLSNAYAKVLKGEAFLVNANLPVFGAAKYNPTRTRKLLLHKDEIISLETRMKQRKLTLVPLKLYTRGRFVKLALSLGKSKRKFEKKQAIKKRDIEREVERELNKT